MMADENDERDLSDATEVRRVWWPGDLYVYGDEPMDDAHFWRDLGFRDPLPDSPALPQVAAWLATYPGADRAASELRAALDIILDSDDVVIPEPCDARLRALADALDGCGEQEGGE